MQYSQEDIEGLIQEEIQLLNKVKTKSQSWSEFVPKPSIWNQIYHKKEGEMPEIVDQNIHKFNSYADKQLYHLVISEEFDFEKIASILSYAFKYDNIAFTEKSCRERWSELHSLRHHTQQIKQRRTEDKRIQSIMNMANPFSLYSVQEIVDKLERSQKDKEREKLKENFDRINTSNSQLLSPQKPQIPLGPEQKSAESKLKSLQNIEANLGYNIFKDSIRKIDNVEEHERLEKEMRQALLKAQLPEETITDKLMFFTPQYGKASTFEVHSEELTPEKMKEIMSYQIEIEKVEREIKANEDLQELKFQEIIKKRLKKEKGEYDIQENWDEYQSD